MGGDSGIKEEMGIQMDFKASRSEGYLNQYGFTLKGLGGLKGKGYKLKSIGLWPKAPKLEIFDQI